MAAPASAVTFPPTLDTPQVVPPSNPTSDPELNCLLSTIVYTYFAEYQTDDDGPDVDYFSWHVMDNTGGVGAQIFSGMTELLGGAAVATSDSPSDNANVTTGVERVSIQVPISSLSFPRQPTQRVFFPIMDQPAAGVTTLTDGAAVTNPSINPRFSTPDCQTALADGVLEPSSVLVEGGVADPAAMVSVVGDIMPVSVRTQTNILLSQAGRQLSGQDLQLASTMESDEGRQVASVEHLIPGGDGAYTYEEIGMLEGGDLSLNQALELAQASFPVNFTTGDGPGSFRGWMEAAVDTLDRSSTGFGHDGNIITVLGGGSYQISDTIAIGAALGGEFADFDTDFNGGTLDSSGVIFAPYIAAQIAETLELRATMGLSSHQYEGTSIAATADFDSTRFFLAAEMGGQYDTGAVMLQPVLQLLYAQEDVGAFTDSAGVYFPGETLELGRFTAGVTVSREFDAGSMMLTPFGVARLEHDFTRSTTVTGVSPTLFDGQDTGFSLGGGLRGDFEGGGTFRVEAVANDLGRDDISNWTFRGSLSIPLD
jgi:outer membrane autotransporter protein